MGILELPRLQWLIHIGIILCSVQSVQGGYYRYRYYRYYYYSSNDEYPSSTGIVVGAIIGGIIALVALVSIFILLCILCKSKSSGVRGRLVRPVDTVPSVSTVQYTTLTTQHPYTSNFIVQPPPYDANYMNVIIQPPAYSDINPRTNISQPSLNVPQNVNVRQPSAPYERPPLGSPPGSPPPYRSRPQTAVQHPNFTN